MKLIWITGKPNQGKTTLMRHIQVLRPEVAAIDADMARESLYPQLGYSAADRLSNIKILTNLAGMAIRYGADAIVAAVSPFEEHRLYAKRRTEELGGDFILVQCYGRPCEMWKGTSYENPSAPDFVFDMGTETPHEAARFLVDRVLRRPRRQLFIGRWQPFHDGHRTIIGEALRDGPVAVGVRLTEMDEDNPYDALSRVDAIRDEFAEADVEVFICPDIDSIHIGRDVGYDIVQHPEVPGISGSDLRRLGGQPE